MAVEVGGFGTGLDETITGGENDGTVNDDAGAGPARLGDADGKPDSADVSGAAESGWPASWPDPVTVVAHAVPTTMIAAPIVAAADA
jgi:hypothetical protein